MVSGCYWITFNFPCSLSSTLRYSAACKTALANRRGRHDIHSHLFTNMRMMQVGNKMLMQRKETETSGAATNRCRQSFSSLFFFILPRLDRRWQRCLIIKYSFYLHQTIDTISPVFKLAIFYKRPSAVAFFFFEFFTKHGSIWKPLFTGTVFKTRLEHSSVNSVASITKNSCFMWQSSMRRKGWKSLI